MIPDSSYAGIYQVVIDDCRAHGAYDPATMGSVPNVGLMARAAEEYGSHDKTFEIAEAGTVRVVDQDGTVLIEHQVEAGDIWRACQTKDVPIRDWVKLAVTRARATGDPAIFWLDETRAHDAQPDRQGRAVPRPTHDTDGLDITIADARWTRSSVSVERIRKGEDTISVTGNVLRDYLTDLFPILELGTSAKMLSVVPLINGGGLFETGAGGSAPKHVQQLVKENYLRWDSLGEFLALAESFEKLRRARPTTRSAKVLGETLDRATGTLPRREQVARPQARHDRQPRQPLLRRAVLGRGAGRSRPTTPTLAADFAELAKTLREQEETIAEELLARAGLARRHRRLLPPRRREGRRGDAPVGDLQRRARLARLSVTTATETNATDGLAPSGNPGGVSALGER